MNIGRKLLLSFGLLIIILSGEIIVNQVISFHAKRTFLKLREEVGPAIKLLDNYKSINSELSLLSNNRVSNYYSNTLNKINGILDVEMPYFNSEMLLLKENLPLNDIRAGLIKKVVSDANLISKYSRDINALLITNEDYNDSYKIKQARDLINKTAPLHFVLDNGIHKLQKEYNRLFERHQNEMVGHLKTVSVVTLIIGIIGIAIGIIVSFQVVHSIINTISKLNHLAKEVILGRFGMQIELDGSDELAVLGKSLNRMSLSLEENFREKQSKLEELQQFAYIATHDLKVPIDNIKGYHNVLSKGIDMENTRTKSIMDWIDKSVDQANKIISDLLRLAKEGNADYNEETLDLNDIIYSVRDSLIGSIKGSDAEIITDFNSCSVVRFSKSQLISIFQNLVGNGLKYCNTEKKPRIEISSRKESGFVCIEFKDNGLGIDLPAQKEKLFGLFKRIHTNAEGSGMGLYMVKRIVEKSGGKIDVESKVDHGSTFSVYIKEC